MISHCHWGKKPWTFWLNSTHKEITQYCDLLDGCRKKKKRRFYPWIINEAFCLGETIQLSEVKIAACYFSVKNMQLFGCIPTVAEESHGYTKNLAKLLMRMTCWDIVYRVLRNADRQHATVLSSSNFFSQTLFLNIEWIVFISLSLPASLRSGNKKQGGHLGDTPSLMLLIVIQWYPLL